MVETLSPHLHSLDVCVDKGGQYTSKKRFLMNRPLPPCKSPISGSYPLLDRITPLFFFFSFGSDSMTMVSTNPLLLICFLKERERGDRQKKRKERTDQHAHPLLSLVAQVRVLLHPFGYPPSSSSERQSSLVQHAQHSKIDHRSSSFIFHFHVLLFYRLFLMCMSVSAFDNVRRDKHPFIKSFCCAS